MPTPRRRPAWLIVKETPSETWYLSLQLLNNSDTWTDDPTMAHRFYSRRDATDYLHLFSRDRRTEIRIVPIFQH